MVPRPSLSYEGDLYTIPYLKKTARDRPMTKPDTTRTDEIDRLINHDQMRLILAIVEARSFSGAAATLGVSQPSISQQVKRIERAAGRTLFRRGRGGVELTNDGEAVVVYARAMLALTDDLRRHFRRSGGATRISIGVTEDLSRTALPSILWLFMREYPNVEIRVISGMYDVLANAIATHAVDLAVMRRFPQIGDVTPLFSDRVGWCGRADLSQPIVDPVPLVLPVAPNPLRETAFEILSAHRRIWRVAFEGSSLVSLEAALQAGLGICPVPRGMTQVGLVTFDERCGLPPLPDVEFVMVEPAPNASEAVLAFAELLRRAAASSYRRPDGGLA